MLQMMKQNFSVDMLSGATSRLRRQNLEMPCRAPMMTTVSDHDENLDSYSAHDTSLKSHNLDTDKFEDVFGAEDTDCQDDRLDEDDREMETEEVEDRMESCDDPLSISLNSVSLPPPPLGVMSFTGDPSVKLASISGTDVAVAQFAENNILPSDLAVLNLVLLNLQQQQLFQMHLLQQLQQQLMYATTSVIPPVAATTNPEKLVSKTLPADVASTSSTAAAAAGTSSFSGILSASSSSTNDKNCSFSNASFSLPETAEKAETLEDRSESNAPIPEDAPLPPIMAMIGMSTRKLPFLPDKQPKDGSQFGVGNGMSSEGQGLAAFPGEGQSARNQCRFCQKVFSSDSALQIHIRSHTGERPYRCSVCGNRFSTKGNLKVHFRCHTDTYPHLQLDQKLPDPVPLLPFTASSGSLHASSSPTVVPLRNPDGALHANLQSLADDVHMVTQPPEIAGGGRIKEQIPSLVATQNWKNSNSNWQDTNEQQQEDDSSGMSTLVRASPFPMTERKTCSESELSSSGSQIQAVPSNPLENETPTSGGRSGLPLLPSAPPPLFPPPHPPPLSLLSSMSSSFSAFPNPLFSSFSGGHRTVISANLAPAPLGLRTLGFGMPQPAAAYFRNTSSIHGKQEDPLEKYMEVKKPETSKMEELVQNIEKKLSDPNQCGICYRTLSCKSALQMHYRTHTGERPFRCKICGRAFTTKGNLKTHMGVHRAKPPVRMLHQCPVCHKQFTNALVLQQHIRMHTGELPKHLPFPPGGMMLVPHAMSYMPPFPGYPFFASGFHPGQQMPGSSTENLKQRLQFGTQFPAGDAPSRTGDEMEMDDLSKSESDDSSSKDNSKHENAYEATSRHDLSHHSSVLDINIESPSNCDDKKISDGEEEDDDDINCSEDDEPDRNCSRGGEILPPPKDNESFACDGDVSRRAEADIQQPDSFERADIFSMQTSRESPRDEDGKANMENAYLEYDNYPPSKYSASLMALQDQVNEIHVSDKLSMTHPLQQMEKIIKRTEDIVSQHSNHVRPNNSHLEMANRDGVEGRTTGSILSNYRVKSSSSNSSFSSVTNRETTTPARNFGFVLSGGLDKSRHHFESIDLSPKSFEAATGKPHTTCRVCYKTFACKSALDIHYRSHTKERPFQCRVCDRAFSTKGNMKQHMMTHKGCGGDNQILFSSDGSSSSNPPRSCPPEDSSTVEKSDVSLQSLPRSPLDNPGVAEDAAKVEEAMLPTAALETPKSRSGFEEQQPPRSSPITTLSRRPTFRHLCTICQKPFSSASALQIHMRTHTGDRPFTCTVCNKAFTTKGNLKVHMGTHMWNNGPSRRGRRMSVEGIVAMAPPPKSTDFFGTQPRMPTLHDLYHFPFHGFRSAGSFASTKLNEVSVIQPMNGRMPHFLPDSATPEMMNAHLSPMIKPIPFSLQPSLAPAPPQLQPLLHKMDNMVKDGSNNNWAAAAAAAAAAAVAGDVNCLQRGNNGELDLSVKKSLPSATPLSPPWMWKTLCCSLCSKVCSSPGALELHLKSHSDWPPKTESPKSIAT